MAEIIKETEVIEPKARKATSYQTVEYLIYFLFGALEVLLIFRLVLKLIGANSFSAFASLIYGITGIFLWPFEGIFRLWSTQAAGTNPIFEPSTLVAIVVYGVLAVGVVKLVRIFSGKQQTD